MGYEYKAEIDGVTYGMHDIETVSIEQPLFDKPSVGNTCNAKLEMTIWPLGGIPRMAKIVPYCREAGTTAWTQLGVFFISTRKVVDDALEIVAYDGMLKGEVEWEPLQSLEFPMTMEAAAREMARLMETELDPRCRFNSSYTIDYPANGYVYRDILAFIAAAHAGNWIMTAEGKLLLIPMFGSLPPETHYLVEEKQGAAITFGGTRILV